MAQTAIASASLPMVVGRTFLHPVVDYLAIGGGLSLVGALGVWLLHGGGGIDGLLTPLGSLIILACNSAHFGASTVRLYTKPGSFKALPFLTMAFPMIALLVTLGMILFPTTLAPHYFSLYLTWSPFHYCAQAYGLAVMYCYRSGISLNASDKRLMWWCCMLTFALAMTGLPQIKAGIWWFLDYYTIKDMPLAYAGIMSVRLGLKLVSMAAPILFVVWMFFRRGVSLPAIVLLLMVSNASWFVFFPEINGFLFATVCHAIQYLFIVCIFHVKDQMLLPGNRRSAGFHAGWFYGACVLLGYALVGLVPPGLGLAGFGRIETTMMVIATLNLHHFIVDGYIWKLGRDPNYRIVTDAPSQPAF